MSLLVDTSVWSLAMRRDATPPDFPQVHALKDALFGADQVFTTGLVLQELLQGFSGPKARDALIERFSALAFLQPGRQDISKPPKFAMPAADAACKWERSMHF